MGYPCRRDFGTYSQRKIVIFGLTDKVTAFGTGVYKPLLGQLGQTSAHSFSGSGKSPAQLIFGWEYLSRKEFAVYDLVSQMHINCLVNRIIILDKYLWISVDCKVQWYRVVR